jgi:hypothetical protein
LKNRLAYFLLFILVFAYAGSAGAQPLSYVYIQGDKEMPFYVKMEGQMMPRYGKNYCILSELAGGIIHIEVLFQQRAYPAQKFTINVPKDGCRGFLLNKQGETYQLYDLQQKKYLERNEEPQ